MKNKGRSQSIRHEQKPENKIKTFQPETTEQYGPPISFKQDASQPGTAQLKEPNYTPETTKKTPISFS